MNLCHDLNRTDFVVKDSVKCWLSDFDKYWKSSLKKGQSEHNLNFNKAVLSWLQNTTEGRRAMVSRQVAVREDGTVFYASFSA